MAKKKTSISLIGAGKVAYHLGLRFYEKGYPIQQVFSRKIRKAQKLSKKLDARATNQLRDVKPVSDIYIIAVKDDAIAEVAEKLHPQLENALIVHTSGALPSRILKPYSKNYGCFYPLQSFSINKAIDFEKLPVCIYSPQKKNRQKLYNLAQGICPNIYEIDDQQKSVLHVAAVFVNNFTNHLYHIGQQIAEDAAIDFAILKPLIRETMEKIEQHDPAEMQTGPAIRGDRETMEKHLQYLQKYPDWARLYRLISQGIAP